MSSICSTRNTKSVTAPGLASARRNSARGAPSLLASLSDSSSERSSAAAHCRAPEWLRRCAARPGERMGAKAGEAMGFRHVYSRPCAKSLSMFRCEGRLRQGPQRVQSCSSSDEGLESALISLAEEHYSLRSGTSGLRSLCPDFGAAQPPRFRKQRSTAFHPFL